MSKKVKVTLTLPQDLYAVGDQIAKHQDKESLSAWIRAKIRSDARNDFGLDLDNPTPADREKIERWVEEQIRTKRRPKVGEGDGGTAPQPDTLQNPEV